MSPARVILATASIHSRRAHDLRQMGIEVIEPEEMTDRRLAGRHANDQRHHHMTGWGAMGLTVTVPRYW